MLMAALPALFHVKAVSDTAVLSYLVVIPMIGARRNNINQLVLHCIEVIAKTLCFGLAAVEQRPHDYIIGSKQLTSVLVLNRKQTLHF